LEITSIIGTATILETPVVIPNLVRTVTELFAIDKEHQIDALDNIKAIAFGDGISGSSIDQEPWKDQWWHELQTASFPRKTVSQLQIYNLHNAEPAPVLVP
jgi:hypothetical protein